MQNIFLVFVSEAELIVLIDQAANEHTADTSLETEDSWLHSVGHVHLASCTCNKIKLQ